MAEKGGKIEETALFEGPLVAVEEQGQLPALLRDEETVGPDIGAGAAVEPELPDGSVKGLGQPGRGPGAAEVVELSLGQKLPEEPVRQGELGRRSHRLGRGPFPAPFQDFRGQRGDRHEPEVDPGTGLPGERFADLAAGHEGGDDEDLFVERVLTAESGQKPDDGAHRLSGIR